MRTGQSPRIPLPSAPRRLTIRIYTERETEWPIFEERQPIPMIDRILRGIFRRLGSPLLAWVMAAALLAVPWVCGGGGFESRSLVVATTVAEVLWLLFWGGRCTYALESAADGSRTNRHDSTQYPRYPCGKDGVYSWSR
jgi:hypothetical protein